MTPSGCRIATQSKVRALSRTAACAYVLLLVLGGAWDYDLRFSTSFVDCSWESSEWIPFSGLLASGRFDVRASLVACGSFLPLGFLACFAWTRGAVGSGRVVGFVAGVLLLIALIQVMRGLLPGRTVNMTGAVMSLAGFGVGAAAPGMVRWPRRWIGALFVCYVACLLLATLWPFDFTSKACSFQVASSSDVGDRSIWYTLRTLSDEVLNTAMTLPLGFLVFLVLAPYGRVSVVFWWSLALGFAIAGCIEVLQCFLPCRTPSLVDLGLNTLGSTLGVIGGRAVIGSVSCGLSPQIAIVRPCCDRTE